MQPGRRKFAIGPCLGRGGFGEVYRATASHPGGLETVVAIKVLRADLDPRGDAIRRLRDEGRLLARLDHPTILRVHDLVLLDGRVALVTEYVEGADLSDCWTGPDPMPPRGLLQVVGRIAGALAAAHRATDADGAPLGLVHRDVKPTNLRVGRHGEVKLLDFGIAWSRATDREARTDSDLVVGSLHYMAPERFVSKRADPAWDVAGLGAVVLEGLTGERFLPEAMRDAVQLAVRPERYERHLGERLAVLARRHPEPVVDLVRQTLAWDADDRLDAATLELRCEQVADALGGASLSRWCRERKWLAPEAIDGALSGRTLTEGTLEIPLAVAAAEPEGAPRLVRAPVPTVEGPSASDPTLRVRPEASTVRKPPSASPPVEATAPNPPPAVETTFVPNPPPAVETTFVQNPVPAVETTFVPNPPPAVETTFVQNPLPVAPVPHDPPASPPARAPAAGPRTARFALPLIALIVVAVLLAGLVVVGLAVALTVALGL